MNHADKTAVVNGAVRWSPTKSLWWTGMTAASIIGGTMTFSWSNLALFLATTGAVLLFGHSLGSHRKLIHDSFQCPKWLEYLFVYTGVQVGLAGPLGLLAQHDLRDHAQRQSDCHDYLRHGRSFWNDGWWQLHCELVLVNPPQLSIPGDIAGDKFYRFLERTWMLQQLPPALLLYAAGGWGPVMWGVCARIAAAVTGHWLIGYFAHNHGGMRNRVHGAAVQGRNVRFASLLTMGESWHNNHHAYPGSARLGLYPGEWDPGWWALALLNKAGLAWNFRLPQDCPPRAQLQPIEGTPALPIPMQRRPVGESIRGIILTGKALLARQGPVQLQGPCVALSPRFLQRLGGRNISLLQLPSQPRLQLTHENETVRGLPALLIAIGSRNVLMATAAVILLPVGTVCELVRNEF